MSLRITARTQKTGEDINVEFKVYPMLEVNLLPGAINEIMASVAHSCCLTQSDRYGLMASILDESVTEEDRRSVDRLLRYVIRGKILVADHN
ncbi:MAG: hypothetical protein WBA93_09805 [Microcoleaceae cyanobacterium]